MCWYVVYCARVPWAASAGSTGSERQAVRLPGVTLDSWIGEQETGTAKQEECLGFA